MTFHRSSFSGTRKKDKSSVYDGMKGSEYGKAEVDLCKIGELFKFWGGRLGLCSQHTAAVWGLKSVRGGCGGCNYGSRRRGGGVGGGCCGGGCSVMLVDVRVAVLVVAPGVCGGSSFCGGGCLWWWWPEREIERRHE